MKVRTSVTISSELLIEAKFFGKRSEIIENALREYLERKKFEKREAKELDILNRIAQEQGDEILENLEYQADIWNEANFTE
jgi:metal-responsive CopG/Arc/MetJ family transcriptional regulator